MAGHIAAFQRLAEFDELCVPAVNATCAAVAVLDEVVDTALATVQRCDGWVK